MSFLAPAAFALAALVGPLVVLYMLRSRRRRVVVPSTMLWEQAGVPVSSAVPWQRLKTTPLLWLQIAVLLLLAVALARPFITQESLLGPHTVIVIDTSGSMAMGSRWEDASSRALGLAEDVSDANLVSVVEAGPAPRVVVAFSRDPAAVATAINELRPTGGLENLDLALRLARGLETPDRPTSILLLTDGGPEGTTLAAEPILGAQQLRFDDLEDNVGISAFSTEPSSEGELRLFLELSNWSEEERTARVEITINDLPALITPVPMGRLGRGRATIPIDAEPGDVVRAAIVDSADGNTLDDVAVLTVPVPRATTVALTGEASAFLDALIRSLPDFVPTVDDGDIMIMDGATGGVFDRPMWMIAPDDPPEGIVVTGAVQNAVVTIQQPGEPLLDDLDMAELVVGEAQTVEAFGWLPLVKAGDVPLVLLGEVGGHRTIYFTFDLTESNLPVLVSFPILGSRILEYLAGANAASVVVEAAGQPIPLAPPAGSESRVVTPDGETVPVPAGATVFSDTGQPGLYRIHYVDAEGAVSDGPVAIRAFVPSESAGDFRTIAVTPSAEVEADRGTLVQGWAVWFLASVLTLLLLEWWVGHRRPVRTREVPA